MWKGLSKTLDMEVKQLKKKQNNNEATDRRICITRKELPQLLGCGLQTADKIAREAEARVVVGHRVLINIAKIRRYIDEVAE